LTLRASHKPIIGLSGGIGAGKSEVARFLASLGAVVLDSDRMAHEELHHPEVVKELRRWWGPQVISADGRPDRKAIARIVFEDPAELSRLEGLLYPRLQRRRDALIAKLQTDPAVRAVVLDAPKLYEAGLDKTCDALIFVDADRETRVRRVASTRGWSEAELTRRENLQIPLDVKMANADYVIVNHADGGDFRPEVERIFSAILDSRSD
jgi:dephospho-CoA kinase